MIESGIVALLRSSTAITALISTRIYAVVVPPNAVFPCLSYMTISKPPAVNLDKSAVECKRIQIDAWGKSYSDVKAIQSALHALLDGKQDPLPDGTRLEGIARDIESDYFENDAELFRAMSEYLVTFPSGQ